MTDLDPNEEMNSKTVIKVVGVGGGGGNAVNRMIDEGIAGVEFVAVNTDMKDLNKSDADVRIALTDSSSRGLGAGADPERGAKAAQDHQSEIEQVLKGADMVFVTAGEGGGTGTGASPIVARAARQQGAVTIGVVTKPFSFEGGRRAASAEDGIEKLRKEVDALIVIPNDRLQDMDIKGMNIREVFQMADTSLMSGVRCITDLISSTNPTINVDFQDVSSVLQNAGTAMFGIGHARGEDRAVQAAEIAVNSPLLDTPIDGATSLLVNIAGPTDMGFEEFTQASELVNKYAAKGANIIIGLVNDDAYGDEVVVSVIATGFEGVARDESRAPGRSIPSQLIADETSEEPVIGRAGAGDTAADASAYREAAPHAEPAGT
ncbi:MAG: cell division protein FtsZ, partial [Scardovia wiggsiae]